MSENQSSSEKNNSNEKKTDSGKAALEAIANISTILVNLASILSGKGKVG
jgi:hypothetical protein